MTRRTDAPRLTSQSLKVLKMFVDAPLQAYSGAELMKVTGLSLGTLYRSFSGSRNTGCCKANGRRARRRRWAVPGAGSIR